MGNLIFPVLSLCCWRYKYHNNETRHPKSTCSFCILFVRLSLSVSLWGDDIYFSVLHNDGWGIGWRVGLVMDVIVIAAFYLEYKKLALASTEEKSIVKMKITRRNIWTTMINSLTVNVTRSSVCTRCACIFHYFIWTYIVSSERWE